MCLPPDVSTAALPSIGRRRDVNPSQWSPDPRAYQNWGASPAQSSGGGWAPYYNMDYYNLPQSGFAKEDACGTTNVIEAAAPLGSLLASALAQQEAPQKWQPQPNWASPQNSSIYCSPLDMHSSYGGGMDAGAALMQSAQGAEAVAAAQEVLSSITHGALESKDEDKLQAGSLFDEFYQDGRQEQEFAVKKLCQPVSKIGKTAGHKNKNGVRHGVKTETKGVDVSIGESDLDGSDEEGEGAPVISEKRRKRMLSNRASAQRSRQRRQERLDTLEVLVAQLRVENAALKTKASSAAASVKKLEDENRVLRERLDSRDLNREYQVSSAKDNVVKDDQSLQTTGANSDLSDLGTSPEGITINEKTQLGDSDSSSENSDPNKRGDVAVGSNNITSIMNTGSSNRLPNQQVSKSKKRSSEGSLQKEWSFNPNYTTVFGTEDGETIESSTIKTTNGKMFSRMGGYLDYVQEYEPQKSLASLSQFSSFSQEMDAFDLDLEHSPDVDKKLLESVEEIWMDGFSDVCFK